MVGQSGYENMAKRCSSCGLENPDHVFYCGKCGRQLIGFSPTDTRTEDTSRRYSGKEIETILTRNLPRIEANAAEKRGGFLGPFRGTFYRSGTLVFKSELEEVALSFNRDGRASVGRGMPSKPTFRLVGSHDVFLTLLRDQKKMLDLPESVTVLLGDQERPDELLQPMLRETTAKLLRILFE